MRTTLDIPDTLLQEARELLQFKSKTDTVIFALRELVRRGHVEDLKRLMGAVDLQIDLPGSRRRARQKTAGRVSEGR
ncbi:MAG: type II toxin-antitoxin system VapB family antitoxin [Acidobacteriota bacterium]